MKDIAVIIILVFTVFLNLGCSSEKHSTVTTQTVVQDDGASAEKVDSTGSSRTETKTTETVSEEGGHGLFHILGEIILLPFRVLAAIF